MRTQASRLFLPFFSIVVLLISIGLIFVYTASSAQALAHHGSPTFYVQRQLIGLLIGIVAYFVMRAISVDHIRKLSMLIFLGTLALTALTLVPGFGVGIHGSRRWLRLPGVMFQPSELLKMGFILAVARMLERKKYHLGAVRSSYVPLIILIGLCSGLLLLQPDFGQAVTIAATGFSLFFIATFDIKLFAFTLAPLIPLAGMLIWFKPYRMKRLLTFLDPWSDPQGAGFQIIQSLISIGSGGMWGIGIGQSKQKFFYLPMQHTDFIFAIIAEETGFIGATILVSLFVAFAYYGLRIAWNIKDTFASFVVLGYTLLLTFSATINLFVTVGLLPTKGLGLPFVSYGSTALVVNLGMLGIVGRCAREDR